MPDDPLEPIPSPTPPARPIASWAPALLMGWNRDRLVASYPEYEWHYAAIDDIVAGFHSPYLRYHAAFAVARACMQTTVIQRVLAVGLRTFAMADLRERELPDARFAALHRNPPPWDEGALIDTGRLDGIADAPRVAPALFDSALAPQWQLVSAAMYRTAVGAIPGTTLDIEGHQTEIDSLLAAAHDVQPILTLRPVSVQRPVERRTTTLGTFETETFVVADPLPARLLPQAVSPALLAAKPIEPHLFVTVRRTAELFANYAPTDGATPPTDRVSVVLRRTVADNDGRMTRTAAPRPTQDRTDVSALRRVGSGDGHPRRVLASDRWHGRSGALWTTIRPAQRSRSRWPDGRFCGRQNSLSCVAEHDRGG